MNAAKAIDAIPVVSSSTERTALFATPAMDQRVFNKATGCIERWNGITWLVDLKRAFVSVDAFGGTADDATDNLTAINAAMAAAATLGIEGIEFTSSGTYRSSAVSVSRAGMQFKIPKGTTLRFPTLGLGVNGITVSANDFALVGRGKLQGPASGVYVQDERGVSMVASVALAVSSITRSTQTATLTTSTPHGLTTGAVVMVTGAIQVEYNGTFTIAVTGASTFTYTVIGSPATPATTATALTYGPKLSGLQIDGVEITAFGAQGVYAKWVDRIAIPNINAHDCGYAGGMFLSCDHIRVGNHARAETITPGTGGNMYGFSFTHDSTGYSSDAYAGTQRALNSFCNDVIVDGAYVNDLDWEGIDCHGGYDIAVINCKVYNTRHGISIPSGSGAASNYAGYKNRVQGCTIDARKPDGTASGRENLSYGINVGGGSTVPNARVIVADNTLINKGVVSSATLGAILGEFTKGAQFCNNILQLWGGIGVYLGAFSDDVLVSENLFQELANPADTAAIAIRHTGTTQRLTVGGNTMTANGGTAGRVGLDIVNMTARPTIEPNNFKAATAAEYQFNTTPGRANGSGVPNVETMAAASGTLDLTAVAGGPIIIVQLNVSSGAFTINTITGVRQGGLVLFVNIGTSSVTLSRANLPGAFPGSADIVIPAKGTSLILFRAATFYAVPSLTNG